MHTVKLEISEQAFEKVMYLLKSLPKNDVKIVGGQGIDMENQTDIKAFGEHTANLIEDWRDAAEDKIWT